MRTEAWEYVSAGAGDEISLRWNIEAYQRIRLNPRYLVDVSQLDTSVTFLGQRFAAPILLAPVAAQRLAHLEGELATARAAAATGTTMVLSSFSNTSVEQVAATAPGQVWFQLYAQRDHGFTRHLVERAEAAGCCALCLTIDTPITGLRTREARAKVDISPLPNLEGMSPSGRDFFERGFADIFSSILDPQLNWKDIEWLRSFSKIPLVLKGVLNPEDAARAAEAGVAAIIVSNHGARNLDTVPATVEVSPPLGHGKA